MRAVYAAIGAMSVEHGAGAVCAVLGVSRSAFYAWRKGSSGRLRDVKAVVSNRIGEVFERHQSRYGSRRVAAELRSEGLRAGRWQVRRRMREQGLKAIQPRSFVPKTTKTDPFLRRSENLLLDRAVVASRLDEVWVGDITYLPMGGGGWLYLACSPRDEPSTISSRPTLPSSSTSKPTTTPSADTRLWATSPRTSSSGRRLKTNRKTLLSTVRENQTTSGHARGQHDGLDRVTGTKTYEWITVQPTSTTTYCVTATDGDGRTAVDSVLVTAETPPTAGTPAASMPAFALLALLTGEYAGGTFTKASGPPIAGLNLDPACFFDPNGQAAGACVFQYTVGLPVSPNCPPATAQASVTLNHCCPAMPVCMPVRVQKL